MTACWFEGSLGAVLEGKMLAPAPAPGPVPGCDEDVFGRWVFGALKSDLEPLAALWDADDAGSRLEAAGFGDADADADAADEKSAVPRPAQLMVVASGPESRSQSGTGWIAAAGATGESSGSKPPIGRVGRGLLFLERSKWFGDASVDGDEAQAVAAAVVLVV